MWGPSPRAEQHWIGFLAFRSPPRVRFHGLVRKKSSNGLCKLGKICSNFTRVSSSNIDSVRHRFRLNLKRKMFKAGYQTVCTKKTKPLCRFLLSPSESSEPSSERVQLHHGLGELGAHTRWHSLVFRVTVCIGTHRYAGFPVFHGLVTVLLSHLG